MSLSYSYYQQTLNSIGCSSAPAVENHGEPCLSAAADILFHAPVRDRIKNGDSTATSPTSVCAIFSQIGI